MAKDQTIEKIRIANAVLSLARTLHHQLKTLEDKKFEEVRDWYDSLVLIQTSIYSTLVLNLYHLLKKGERHSIHELIRTSIAHLRLSKKSADEMTVNLNEFEEQIANLKQNRDKRISHFDTKSISSLDDPTIERLLIVAEAVLKQLNEEALSSSHSYVIPLSRGMESIMGALQNQIESEKSESR